jgi:hypothetical protein
MEELRTAILESVEALDELHGSTTATPSDKLLNAVEVACEAMVQLFTVHPYANGNGHAGRFVLWALLLRYGYAPRPPVWPVEPSPVPPERQRYSELVKRYRDGHREDLVAAVLEGLVR